MAFIRIDFERRLDNLLNNFSFRKPKSESERIMEEVEKMEETMNQTLSTLDEKIKEIQRLDLELDSLLAATNQENKDFDTEVSKIKKRQTKVIKSFDTLKTKLDKYNNMASDIASRLFIFLHLCKHLFL